MLYLLLKVGSAVGMGLALKHADTRSLDRLPLIRVNYAVAAVIGFFASIVLDQTHLSRPALLLGAGTGMLFVVGLLVWTRAIGAAGLALSVVAMRSAVVIPLLASAVIWRERLAPLELAGSAVALLALALVLSEARTRAAANPSSRRTASPSLLWLVLLFLTDGLVMVPALAFRQEMSSAETMPFQTVIFATAFLLSTLLYYLGRPRLSRQTLQWGSLLGVANLGNYLFLVLALTVLPGLVVYPAIAAGEVGLTAVAGRLLWKERLGGRSWLGIALVVAALVMIQLGKAGGA